MRYVLVKCRSSGVSRVVAVHAITRNCSWSDKHIFQRVVLCLEKLTSRRDKHDVFIRPCVEVHRLSSGERPIVFDLERGLKSSSKLAPKCNIFSSFFFSFVIVTMFKIRDETADRYIDPSTGIFEHIGDEMRSSRRNSIVGQSQMLCNTWPWHLRMVLTVSKLLLS